MKYASKLQLTNKPQPKVEPAAFAPWLPKKRHILRNVLIIVGILATLGIITFFVLLNGLFTILGDSVKAQDQQRTARGDYGTASTYYIVAGSANGKITIDIIIDDKQQVYVSAVAVK